MRKLISVVLVLAMLASMLVYLPLGVSATGATSSETIYSENFDGKDGTYTLAELATKLGWKLLRGDNAATAVIDGGVLTINPGTAKDVVFEIDTDVRYMSNHTLQYDMTKFYKSGDLAFAGLYTGTDNGEKVTAVVAKTTYENYNHIALALDSVLNEKNQGAFKYIGGDHGQCRPESIPGGGDRNTWKVVYDVTGNQVDAYAAGARINSTQGAQNDWWADKNIADYVGQGAYLRVQKIDGASSFDNISIVTGGEGVSYGEYAFYQDFNGIADGTYTGAQLAALTGFQSFVDTTADATMVYKIANGRLEVVANGTCTHNKYTYKNNPQFASLYIPEMEASKEAVVIEYDLTYLYDANVAGSANSGDSPFGMELYGRRSDFHVFWQLSQKGFPQWGFYKGSHTVDGTSYSVTQNGTKTKDGYYPQSQGRWETTAFNAPAASYDFANSKGYGSSIMNSTEHVTVVLSVKDGMAIYVNGVIAVQLTATAYEAWTTTLGGGTAADIIGNLMRFRAPAGCHFALDNFKVTVDPAADTSDNGELLITEWNCGVTATGYCTQGGSEYIEVYNNSDRKINIYNYAVVNVATANSMDQFGKATGLNNVHLLYPGTHTFKSIKVDEGGAPLYTYDITNPSYAEGWLEPGETVILWNKTDSMHNGAHTGPSVNANGYGSWGGVTEEMFRAGMNIPETTKVFEMYNDYNRAFNNSGNYLVGLADRAVYQPDYNPATNTGDETLVDAVLSSANLSSMVYNFFSITNASCQVQTGHYQRFEYVANNLAIDGVALAGRTTHSAVAAAMTPGVIEAAQQRDIAITVDGNAKTAKLGAKVAAADVVALEGFDKLLWAEIDGKVVAADATVTVINPVTINTGAVVAMTTLAGASVRINYDAGAGLRWITAINQADLAALLATEGVANVEFGTLIARAEELTDYEQTLSMDYVTEDGSDGNVVRKVAAYDGEWYTTSADYEGFGLFAGGVGNMRTWNYSKTYCAVGYLTVTLESGETYTVYGDYSADSHNRDAVTIIEDAMAEYEAWEEDNTLDCSVTEEDYYRLDEYYNEAE